MEDEKIDIELVASDDVKAMVKRISELRAIEKKAMRERFELENKLGI